MISSKAIARSHACGTASLGCALRANHSRGRLCHKDPRRGFGLVELLISLAIAAALLTATAVAVNASFTAYSVNQEQSSLAQRARLAMFRIVNDIRGSGVALPDTDSKLTDFSTGKTVQDTGIYIKDDDAVSTPYRTYSLNSDSQLIFSDNGTEHVMLEGVAMFKLTLEPMQSAAGIRQYGKGAPFDHLRRATILLTLRNTSATSPAGEGGSQDVTVSCSVVPRRNVW